MYAPASFKAARRETPAGRLFSGVDFSGEIPYHRSILSSAVRCGKWSEQDSREELLILSARRPSASPAPPAGSRGWQNWYSGKMEESGFDEVQTDRCGSVLGRIRGRRPPSNEQGILLEVRRFAPAAFDISAADQLLRGCAARRKAAPKAVFIKS